MKHAVLMAAAIALMPIAASAQSPNAAAVPVQAANQDAKFQQDRQAILSQVGNFRVRFDMRENAVFRDGYEAYEDKISSGNEIVRLVYDQGSRISLQHILVMEHGGQSIVVKHWRQDWVYMPQNVLTYAGPNQWTLTPVPAAEREGAWSQTVWQTDDSPRYGGVGRWTYANGVTEWTSNDTWRPLARRDAVRNPVYDRYLGVNRHALTATGWVHLQDNMKMATDADGKITPVVHEDVVNSYRRWDGFSPQAGEDYWAKTSDYWAAVRGIWDETIAAGNGVRVEEVGDTGSATGVPLMDLADKINDGELETAAAVAQARDIIRQNTSDR